MMVKSVLHIGAGKCGSSSLQARLSENPRFEAADGTRYEYMCLKDDGRLMRGDECRKVAEHNAYGYSASVSVKRFYTQKARRLLRGCTRTLANEACTPIFSFEGWINEARRFSDWSVLEALRLDARVVVFIRPQVEWINSSWWQWGAWKADKSFEQWLTHWKARGFWAKTVTTWLRIKGVREVRVFTITDDVVAKFFRYLDAQPPERGTRENSGLDGNVLRFLQQQKHLCSGARQSAIHFMLGRHIQKGGVSVPWVLSNDLIAELIEFYRQDNQRLLSLVDEKTRSEILADPRWWNPSAFSGRRAENPDSQPLQTTQVSDVAEKAIKAILNLDKKLRDR